MIGKILEETERAVMEDPAITENTIHEMFVKFPFILDPVGKVVSKPKFVYPIGESPMGKEYVEPDFFIMMPNYSYIVVEIERPQKPLQTQAGHPSHQFTQAQFQSVEFRDFAERYSNRISRAFPGIDIDCEYWLVIGRNQEDAEKLNGRRRLLKKASTADKIYTFGELFRRVKAWYEVIRGMD